MTRIFVAAGEASGDLQASLLVRALRARRDGFEFFGVGGDRMAAAGVRLVVRSEELAVVGILEVIERLPRILDALGEVRAALGSLRPALFLPVDFPDFNFRLLPAAARAGARTVYYIGPQVWAWRPGRIEHLRRWVDRMIVIFPFEAPFYERAGVPVTWVGHPLRELVPPADAPERERARSGIAGDGPVVALLPGSRHSEISRIAPVLAAASLEVNRQRRAERLPPVRYLAGCAPGLRAEDLGLPFASLSMDGLEAMRLAEAAIVASGTATLEAALLGRPIVVVYRMHPLTYAIARRAVTVPHIAMANLLAGRRVVPELVQHEATPGAVAGELRRLLENPVDRARAEEGMAAAREALGPPGAADRAAEVVLAELDRAPGSRP